MGDASQIKTDREIAAARVPGALRCPLSGSVLTKPVIMVKTGAVYERSELETHLRVEERKHQERREFVDKEVIEMREVQRQFRLPMSESVRQVG